MAFTSRKMAPTIFVFALVVLAKLSANYAHPATAPTSGLKANHDWPKECENRTYCWTETKAYKNLKKKFEELLRDEELYYRVGAEMGDRLGGAKDVANCNFNSDPTFKRITMIRDKDNVTWYIPQTANYTMLVQVVECTNKNRIVPSQSLLDQHTLQAKKVFCVEQRVHYKFPVLSQDQSKIEKSRAPYNGLPMYCSAKIVK